MTSSELTSPAQPEPAANVKESSSDDPIFQALSTLGGQPVIEDERLIHRRYVMFHIIKFILYIPFCILLSKLYTLAKIINALSDICRVLGNLLCLWASDPLRITADALLTDSSESVSQRVPLLNSSAYWTRWMYHIGVVVSDVFTPLSRLTKVIAKIAVLSMIYWFVHWREFDKQAESIYDSCSLFLGSLRLGFRNCKKTMEKFWDTPAKLASAVRGLVCGVALILMELYSLYYVYSLM